MIVQLPPQHRTRFDRDGFVVVRGLFAPGEATRLRDHYTSLAELRRPPDPTAASDPLLDWPRLGQMHRWDDVSLDWLLDPRLRDCLVGLLGREPYAAQTMIYFKPPGARGQALHQDNYFLRAQPGTCVAAWLALDVCDEANGCLRIVPGSQTWPILCTVKADTRQSFTDVTVPLPEGAEAAPVTMEPGDVLFFNGQVVHGSFSNGTPDRFRRSLIAHYIDGNAETVARYYHPALRMDGTVVQIGESEQGGRCGRWVDEDGAPRIELSGYELVGRDRE